jgi:hypothetical protein
MTNYRVLTVWTLILNSVIIIGAGHGIVPLGVLEILWLYSLFGTEQYPLHSSVVFVLCTVAGQAFLINSLFIKYQRVSSIQILGLILLWIGFLFLINSEINESGFVSFIIGIPFLILSGKLFHRTSIKS